MRTAILCLLLAACGDDTGSGMNGDGGGDGGGGDMGVGDLAGLDLSSSNGDMICGGQFPGFPGVSPSLRVFDCSCGCMIDNFEGSIVSSVWNNAGLEQASYVPHSGTGLEVDINTPDGGVGLAALSSLSPSNQWYLSGDFDMQIDYQLLSALPPGGEVILEVTNAMPPVNSSYSIERDTSTAGAGEYTGTVAGIQPVHASTTATHGTLQITRQNAVTTIAVFSDGTKITQYTGAISSNLAVLVTAGIGDCPGCSMSIQWHNLKLNSGRLVDQP